MIEIGKKYITKGGHVVEITSISHHEPLSANPNLLPKFHAEIVKVGDLRGKAAYGNWICYDKDGNRDLGAWGFVDHRKSPSFDSMDPDDIKYWQDCAIFPPDWKIIGEENHG
jgi:hypothetical protein